MEPKARLPDTVDRKDRRPILCVCIFLALATWTVFGQTLNHGFVNYDDPTYVYENLDVNQGLTGYGIFWAFTHIHASNWHPLTWISHMLDCQLYGANAGGHHLTSVLLHTVTAMLLFELLRQLTRFLWRSAFVAAVFAIHPLHVESVAWIAERKDVLSAFFAMLSLLAYTRYAQMVTHGDGRVANAATKTAHSPQPAAHFFWLAVLFFGLGLMSKPMLVTLPFVLLLLDYWPLNRWSCQSTSKTNLGPGGWQMLGRLFLEKLPWFGLAVATSVVTLFAQRSAIATVGPPFLRLGNALVAYVAYLEQMFWPVGLAVFYPYPPGGLELGKIITAIILLLAVSAAAVAVRRKHPWFLIGWLWYLGMLVPVSGLIQVGASAQADRYTYLPQIGLYVVVTWAAAEAFAGWQMRRWLLGGGAVIILSVLIFCARTQVAYWRDSVSLWEHTLACTETIGNAQDSPSNCRTHYCLGNAYFEQGNWNAAIDQFQKTVALNPRHAQAHNNLGYTLLKIGNDKAAITEFQKALVIKPGDAIFQNNLAWLFATAPQAEFRNGSQAVALARRLNELTCGTNPDYLATLAAAYAEAGQFGEARADANKAKALARVAGRTNLVAQINDEQKFYLAGIPFHQASP